MAIFFHLNTSAFQDGVFCEGANFRISVLLFVVLGALDSGPPSLPYTSKMFRERTRRLFGRYIHDPYKITSADGRGAGGSKLCTLLSPASGPRVLFIKHSGSGGGWMLFSNSVTSCTALSYTVPHDHVNSRVSGHIFALDGLLI